jgi:hypothetical protein
MCEVRHADGMPLHVRGSVSLLLLWPNMPVMRVPMGCKICEVGSVSEVADFRKQQAGLEQAAQQGLNGFAIVSNHAAIDACQGRGAEFLVELINAGRLEEAEKLSESTEFWKKMGNI